MTSWIVHREVAADPRRLATRDRWLLETARATRRGTASVYDCAGDVLGLGRYHVVPSQVPGSSVRLHRRQGGGRAVPLGEGFAGLSLALPDRDALVPGGHAPLAPEQVLNRAVRGILAALEAQGVDAYYPGRDLVTARGRIIGALTFAAGEQGGVLVEAAIALGRSFAEVTRMLDQADPSGVVPAALVGPGDATSVAEETGRGVDLATFAEALRSGYAARLGIEATLSTAVLPPFPADDEWLSAGRLAPGLDRHARASAMLGTVEAHVALEAGRVVAMRLTGDFIAPADTIRRLEEGLRGVAADRTAILERIRTALGGPGDFLLGVRPVETLADLVLSACGP